MLLFVIDVGRAFYKRMRPDEVASAIIVTWHVDTCVIYYVDCSWAECEKACLKVYSIPCLERQAIGFVKMRGSVRGMMTDATFFNKGR